MNQAVVISILDERRPVVYGQDYLGGILHDPSADRASCAELHEILLQRRLRCLRHTAHREEGELKGDLLVMHDGKEAKSWTITLKDYLEILSDPTVQGRD